MRVVRGWESINIGSCARPAGKQCQTVSCDIYEARCRVSRARSILEIKLLQFHGRARVCTHSDQVINTAGGELYANKN